MKSMKKWMSALLALLLLASLSVSPALAAVLYYEAREEVNLRKGPGTEYAILTSVPTGDVVTVTGDTDELWWKVSYTNSAKKTYQGYINSNYLKPSKKKNNDKPKNTAPLGCYATTLNNMGLHRGPGTSYAKRVKLPVGSVVEVTDTTNKYWFKVNYITKSGKTYKAGWLKAAYLKKAPEPYNIKSATDLRKTARKSSKSLCKLPKGAYVSVTAIYSKYWYKISYTDIDKVTHVGFVLKSKLKKGKITNKPYKQVDPDAAAKTLARNWLNKPRAQVKSKTNLMSRASKKGKKLAAVPKNAVVAVVGSSGKWKKVIYNDPKNKKLTGYLQKSALKSYKEPNAGAYVTKVPTQLRSADSQTASVLFELPQYSLIQVTDSSEKSWFIASYTDPVTGKSYKGFVFKSHAEKYKEKNAGTYYTTVESALRETASDTGEVLATVPMGSEVQVRSTYNPKWYVVTYTNAAGVSTNGFFKASYLRKRDKGTESWITRVETPLRVLPSETGEVGSMVPEKQTVIVLDKYFSNWWWVKYVDANGQSHTGYVYTKHLMTQAELEALQSQDAEPEEEPEQPEEPAEQPEPADKSAEASDEEIVPAEAESSEEPAAEEEPVAEEEPAEESAQEAEQPAESAQDTEEKEDKEEAEDKEEQSEDKASEEASEAEAQEAAEEPEEEAAA